MENQFEPQGKLQIVHKHGQPYGIRDDGGYLLFFPKVNKYTGQEQRYLDEIRAVHSAADKIIKALSHVDESLPSDYDTGLINDYGGGDVDWWQDYIREEVSRCNNYWRNYLENKD